MITTDTGAKKIEATDNWRQIFDIHNDSVDAYDANVAALQDALGIVVDGNQSAVSASSGQFIILKNSSIVDSGDVMLADGLYTAAKAIPANTVIDKTYLTADAAGGLNALNGKITNKQSLLLVTAVSAVPGSTSNARYTKSAAKDGYTPMGIVGMEAIASFSCVDTLQEWYINGETIYYRCTPASTSAGIYFYVLYKKNE